MTVDKDEFVKLATKHNIKGSVEELCRNRDMRILLCKELDSLGKQAGLMSFEQAKNIHIDTETFITRQLVSSTMKLQRFQAKKYYEK